MDFVCFRETEIVERQLSIHQPRVRSWFTGNQIVTWNVTLQNIICVVLRPWQGILWYWLWNPQDHKTTPAPSRSLHIRGLKTTQVTVAPWVVQSQLQGRADQAWHYDFGVRIKFFSLSLPRIRRHSQTGLTPVHIACIFLTESSSACHTHLETKNSLPTPYLYKTNFLTENGTLSLGSLWH